jgi:hypothetical protein
VRTPRILRVHFRYWTAQRRRRHDVGQRSPLATAYCDPRATLQLLGAASQPALSWVDRALAGVSIFLRRRRRSSRTETGCWAVASGNPVRKAQRSTDGFWTVDVRLSSFAIGEWKAPEGRYVRVEIEPRTEAHRIASRRRLRPCHRIDFGGPVLVDEDGPFLEVHPDAEFRVFSDMNDAPPCDRRLVRRPLIRKLPGPWRSVRKGPAASLS